MTDPTADTSAIEAALDNLAEEYDRLRTLHDAALADNARLTAALGEAEGERDFHKNMAARFCGDLGDAVEELKPLRLGAALWAPKATAELQAELDRLQAENKALDAYAKHLLEKWVVTADRRGELLRRAEMWCNRAVHHLGCPADVNLWQACNCGRDAFVAAIVAELAGEGDERG